MTILADQMTSLVGGGRRPTKFGIEVEDIGQRIFFFYTYQNSTNNPNDSTSRTVRLSNLRPQLLFVSNPIQNLMLLFAMWLERI